MFTIPFNITTSKTCRYIHKLVGTCMFEAIISDCNVTLHYTTTYLVHVTRRLTQQQLGSGWHHRLNLTPPSTEPHIPLPRRSEKNSPSFRRRQRRSRRTAEVNGGWLASRTMWNNRLKLVENWDTIGMTESNPSTAGFVPLLLPQLKPNF